MSDLLQYGGPVLWLQAALAFMAIVYIIERLLYYHSVRVNVADFLVGISNHLRQKGFAEAIHQANRLRGDGSFQQHDGRRSEQVGREAPRSDCRAH